MIHPNWQEAIKKPRSPDLFPGCMPEDLLKKCPPMYLTTAEHDQFRRDNEWFAPRLKKCGKFLGLFIQPGGTHEGVPHEEICKIFAKHLGCKTNNGIIDEM